MKEEFSYNARIDALKEEIDKYRPIDAYILKQVREYFRIGMTYSSNALEGNSLTETETKIVIEDGITIGGKPIRDHLEALGHSEAYDLLFRWQSIRRSQKLTLKSCTDCFTTGSMRARLGNTVKGRTSSPGRISSPLDRSGYRSL